MKSLGGIVIAAAAALYWGSQMLEVAEITHAISTRDAETVNGLIDFPALRSSLKAEAQQVALYRLSGHQKPGTNLLAGLASGLMEPFVNALVESVATPEGIRGLLTSQVGLAARPPPPQVDPVPLTNGSRWAMGWPRQGLAIALGTAFG
ncbi:MAG: DUF2939 domain-containing protein [Cyanobium sp. LacPavin_0920_WC12_MAG_62_9]|nr:DUF2939 domain-containing protein [Cyanobium sp. LacPavin_0920_WC12_MAG_62_9]